MTFCFGPTKESGDEMYCFESDAKKRWKKKSIHSRRTTTTTRATKEEEGFV